jgi:hypothetical protein
MLLTLLLTVFLCPLQEMPKLGRNPTYIVTLAFWVLFQGIPPAAGPHLVVLLVFRFLAGFMAGPALATSGASSVPSSFFSAKKVETDFAPLLAV